MATALHYLDRDGQPLARDRWRDLVRDPAYVLVSRAVLADGTEIRADWLGIVSDWEAEPRPFVVRSFPPGLPRGDKAQYVHPECRGHESWHADEFEAMTMLWLLMQEGPG